MGLLSDYVQTYAGLLPQPDASSFMPQTQGFLTGAPSPDPSQTGGLFGHGGLMGTGIAMPQLPFQQPQAQQQQQQAPPMPSVAPGLAMAQAQPLGPGQFAFGGQGQPQPGFRPIGLLGGVGNG